jgi:hypothetical protein
MNKVQVKTAPVSNPHSWMTSSPGLTQKQGPKKESIREWYSRKTGWAFKAICFMTTCSIATMCVMWASASLPQLQRLQTFNGALVIPMIGGIWIFGFIYMFLTPSREASFRGQESLEEGVEIIRAAVMERIGPAAEIWGRVGERVERELPGMLEKANATLEDLQKAARNIEIASQRNGQLMEEAKPAIDALKRIEHRVEMEINSGLFENMRAAADSVKSMAGIPKDATEPDYKWAAESLKQAKARAADVRPRT